MLPAPDAHGRFPPLERVRIENLACTWPAAHGLALTHWASRTLQQEVIRQEICASIHYTTVARILAAASLQPHRWRYWKTTVWDAAAIRQAAHVLWCYEHVAWLLECNILVVCLDEKANLQVLERAGPVRPMRPGQIEQQEWEYVRHGTVNFLAAMTLHDGRMWATCLERNDGEHFRPALQRLLAQYPGVEGFYLVMDNGPSHIAGPTRALLQERRPWVRVCLTPARASWLNQAELLLRAFSARYLDRGHWESRPAMIEHLEASWPEYNARYAHPFSWSWTRRDFRKWLAERAASISCTTSATVH
jgi:DDE superfamily endonuclease